jgi:hypothetical protein
MVGAVLALAVSASSAQAVTFIKDTFTLSDDHMSDPLSSSSASGSYGVIFYSNGKDYLFGHLTVDELVQGTPYTYHIDYNCLSTVLHCGHPAVPSQVPGGSGFNVQLNIDTFAYHGNPSTVPTSFSDFIYESSGEGTLNEEITRGKVPEPATWALMLIGAGAVGWALRRRRAPLIAC